MKLLIDCTTTQDEFAGHGIGNLVKTLTSKLVELHPECQFRLMLFDGPSDLDQFLERKFINVEVERIGPKKPNNYMNGVWFKKQYLPVIKKYRKDHIYFAPYFWRGVAPEIIPTVMSIHDMALPIFNIYSEQSVIHNILRKWQYWSALNKARQAQAIVAISGFTKESFLSFYPDIDPDKVTVALLGIEIDEANYPIDQYLPSDWGKRGYFIYLGGTPYKNKNSTGVIRSYYNFIKSLGNLEKSQLPYLVVAGSSFEKNNKQMEELHELIESLGLNELVKFIGRYSDESKYSLLNKSIAFIHLSLLEGFGIAVAEAMRSKTPVIAHNGSSYPEVVGDTGYLVNGNDFNEVGEAMRYIYENRNSKEVQQKIMAAYARSKSMTWDECAEKFYDVFKKVEYELIK